MGRLDRLINLDDFERAARKRLPKPVFDSIAGGAADEVTLRENKRAFARIKLAPKALLDSKDRRLDTTIFGERISLPVMLGPTGFQRMSHREAELATARGAHRAGTGYVLATTTSVALETVAAESDGVKWKQLYPPKDRDDAAKLIKRAGDAGFSTLCVTIDTPMFGLRERDKRNRLAIPFKLRPGVVWECAKKPSWSWDFVRGGAGRLQSTPRLPMSVKDAGKAIARTKVVLTYDYLDFIRERWSGNLVVKGVQRGDDCGRLIEHGVDGIVVSNHGGRQLDTVPATIEILPEVVAAVDGRAAVFLDGGIRRGTDVVKALALGADAVLLGRPYVYGLAIGGEHGVARAVDVLRQEMETAIGLLGATSVDDLDETFLARSSRHAR